MPYPSLPLIHYLLVFHFFVSFSFLASIYCIHMVEHHSSNMAPPRLPFQFSHPFSCKSCLQCFPPLHSLPLHSLPHSLPPSLPPSLPHSLPHTLINHAHPLLDAYSSLVVHLSLTAYLSPSEHSLLNSWMFFTLCEPVTQLTFFLSLIPNISSALVPQSTIVSFHHCSGLLLELLALCTLILDAHLLHDANLPVYHTCHLLHPCSRLLWTLLAYAPMSFTHTCCFVTSQLIITSLCNILVTCLMLIP